MNSQFVCFLSNVNVIPEFVYHSFNIMLAYEIHTILSWLFRQSFPVELLISYILMQKVQDGLKHAKLKHNNIVLCNVSFVIRCFRFHYIHSGIYRPFLKVVWKNLRALGAFFCSFHGEKKGSYELESYGIHIVFPEVVQLYTIFDGGTRLIDFLGTKNSKS
jgi:hypothetical protein